MSLTHNRARVAVLTRYHGPDDPQVIDARRNLAAAKLEEYVSRVVAEAPPLSQAQADRIAGLLRPAGGDAK